MLRIAYFEEQDLDFIRWTGNLLRTFLIDGRAQVVGARDRPDLFLASIWRRHRFPSQAPVVLVSNENWRLYPSHYPLERYAGVIATHAPSPEHHPYHAPDRGHFISYPYEAVHFDLAIEHLYALRASRLVSGRTRFCCFVVSNTVGELSARRHELFTRIHAYQRVDSAGAVLNNTGYRAPRGLAYLDWLAQYRFVISIENSEAPGYVSEKALQASLAGAIPIYQGSGRSLFNPEAFLDATDEDLIGQLARLDSNPEEYRRRQQAELYRVRPTLREFEQRFAERFLR